MTAIVAFIIGLIVGEGAAIFGMALGDAAKSRDNLTHKEESECQE